MGHWTSSDVLGPEDEDWRVPVAELAHRQRLLATQLSNHGIEAALIHHPVDLYYFTGGRQDSTFFIPSTTSDAHLDNGGAGPVAFVRRSVERARYEAGGDDAIHAIEPFPRMATFADTLRSRGLATGPGLQYGEVPGSFLQRFEAALTSFGALPDITSLVHRIREVKSDWELEQMDIAAHVQLRMFETIETIGGEGVTELDLVAAVEAISRSEGFSGNVQMRRFPLQCDRGVIVAGRAGGIPSFFDSAVGGTGPHPLGGMGAGFSKIKRNEPVLVDLVHAHRGYMVDATRMFVSGHLAEVWHQRLDDMLAVKDEVVEALDDGFDCSVAWEHGSQLAEELGHGEHLMGMKPDQSQFLGHSIGLQLDESPVVARGFDRPLPIGGTMAIEPKLVFEAGSIGIEDTWVRDHDGMRPLSADTAYPWLTEWES